MKRSNFNNQNLKQIKSIKLLKITSQISKVMEKKKYNLKFDHKQETNAIKI